MWPLLPPCQLPPQPQKHPHCRHLPLCRVPQDLLQPACPEEPPPHPLRDAAPPLPRLRQGLPSFLPALQPPTRPPEAAGADLPVLPASLSHAGQLQAPHGDHPRPDATAPPAQTPAASTGGLPGAGLGVRPGPHLDARARTPPRQRCKSSQPWEPQ